MGNGKFLLGVGLCSLALVPPRLVPKTPPGRPIPDAPTCVLFTLCASDARKERSSHNMHHSGCEYAQLLYQSSHKSNKYNTIDNLTGSFIHVNIVKIELLCLHVRHYTNRQVQFALLFSRSTADVSTHAPTHLF